MRGCSCRGTAGFAHVSCLVEQAKILCAEAEENNLGNEVENERFERWHTCSLCERRYHGVVQCALGWACWKTYVGRPETDETRGFATPARRRSHEHAIAASNYTYLLLRPDAPARLDGLEEGRVLLVRPRVFEGQS